MYHDIFASIMNDTHGESECLFIASSYDL